MLLSDDKANRERAVQEGVAVHSLAQYVKGMVDYPDLVDKLSRGEGTGVGGQGKTLFPEHLSPSQVR